MKISVKAKTNAREDKVEQQNGVYIVSVKALPVDGKANNAIIKILARHFGVAASCITLVSGQTSKHKIFDIQLQVK